MCSKIDLKNYLEEISPSARFIRFEYASPEKFRIELRCHVDKDQPIQVYVQFARNWITKFSKFTATTWIVLNSFLKMKRLVFRKSYTCNRSSHNKSTKKDLDTRNQECKAKVDFKMKLTTRNTLKNDKLLRDGLNLNIRIDFVHSHKVRTPESYQLLRNTPEMILIFQKYFDTGCASTAAKSYHELTLLDKYGENCPEVFENASMNPPLRNVLYLHIKLKKKKMLRTGTAREILESKCASFKNTDVDVVLSETDLETSLIVTPFMKTVIAEVGLEYVMVDSTEVPNGPTATFIFAPTAVGALPVACALHGKYELNPALELARSHFEKVTGQPFYAKVLMLDHSEGNKILPSVQSFQSRYSLCSETWCWLNDDENKIERKKRHPMMLAIHSLIYADSFESAEKAYSKLQENDVTSDPKLKEYLKNMWDMREKWMTFEHHILKNNLVEISIRFLKTFINEKCKSMNDIIMIEVVTKILENHYKRILASYVKKNKTVATYTKFLTKEKYVLSFGTDVRRIKANEFRITSKARPKYIDFRTDTICCTCLIGKKGIFCEHLAAIINVIECKVMKVPILTEEEIVLYNKITGGEVAEEIKPEISEDIKHFIDNVDVLSDDDLDLPLDENVQSDASSPKAEAYDDNDDDFYAEVKAERPDRFDPLDEQIEPRENGTGQTDFDVITQNIPIEQPTTSNVADMKKTYETALRAVNDEFRRLNRFFSENPNASNLETITRLARELSKIRPVEQITLDSMILKLNANRKRKRDS